jgi:hypothetical protein
MVLISYFLVVCLFVFSLSRDSRRLLNVLPSLRDSASLRVIARNEAIQNFCFRRPLISLGQLAIVKFFAKAKNGPKCPFLMTKFPILGYFVQIFMTKFPK